MDGACGQIKDIRNDDIDRCTHHGCLSLKVKRDQDPEDMFAANPPLESNRVLVSRTACKRKDGTIKKLLFMDKKQLA